MSRTCKTYYVESLGKSLTLKELEKYSGIPKKVIYERLYKCNWDIESAIKVPKKIVKKKLNNINAINAPTTTEYIDDKTIDKNIDDFLFKRTKYLCSVDYEGYDENGDFCFIKLIDTSDEKVKAKGVTPFNSHPHRYPKAWAMFIPLIDLAKERNGYLYIINYDSKNNSEYRILKVIDYLPNMISSYLIYEPESCGYLKIEDNNIRLNKYEFNKWIETFIASNKPYKNGLYKKFRTNNGKPSYYKDPKPSKDHLGKTYDSFNKMCKAYNMNPTTVKQRMERGWTTEEALTIQAGQKRA